MEEESYVHRVVRKIDKVPEIKDTPISGWAFRNFFKGAVIYRDWLDKLFGLQFGKGSLIVSFMDTKLDQFKSLITDRNLLNQKSLNGFSDLSKIWPICPELYQCLVRPTGEQVANYILLCAKAVYVAARVKSKTSKYSEELEQLAKLLGQVFRLEINSMNDLFNDLRRGATKSEVLQGLGEIQRLQEPLSTSPKRAQIKEFLKRLSRETSLYCQTQFASQRTFTIANVESKLRQPQGKHQEQLWKAFGNTATIPLWFFLRVNEIFDQAEKRSSKELVTLSVFQDFVKLTKSPNQTLLKQLLGRNSVMREWRAFTLLTILLFPFSNRERNTVFDFSTNMNKGKNANDPVWLSIMVEEHLTRAPDVYEEYFLAYVKFLQILSRNINPAPALQSEEEVAKQQQMELLRLAEEEETKKPLQERMAERRIQLKNAEDKNKKDDSGAMLPILLLGAAIFLLSR